MSEAYKKVETARLVTRPKASEFIKNIFDKTIKSSYYIIVTSKSKSKRLTNKGR